MSRAKRESSKAALLFIDLDGFKLVNDTYGHAAGDSVLIEAAQKIQATHREVDAAARIGGDEFVVILESLENEDEALRIAKRIIAELVKSIKHNDAFLTISASIGCAIYPDHAQDLKNLINSADTAMYSVKRAGRNGVAFAKSIPAFGEAQANYN